MSLKESDGGEEPKRSRRGGKRPGAGRKKKGADASVKISGIDLKAVLSAPVPENIDAVAQKHGRKAIDTLVKQLVHGSSEAAKVNAANAILDRGYGRPSVDAAGAQMTLFGPGISVFNAEEIRDYARTFANLAIEMLDKIAMSGDSESARVSAAKSMLDRGIGMAAPARVPASIMPRTPGKKEEAVAAARSVASGKFATPSPPRIFTETVQ